MTESDANTSPITSTAAHAIYEFGEAQNSHLLTIVFTDLVDSTGLQSTAGNHEAARLTKLHRQLVRDRISAYDAREIEWAGDSCLAVFTKPSDAVEFALSLQSTVRTATETEPNLPSVRIGLHIGEILVDGQEAGGPAKENVFGLQVSETARVMSLARGGQIYCTRAVFDNAQSTLKGRNIDGVGTVAWVNHGPFELQGSTEPVEVCEVGEEGFASLAAPATNEKCRPIKGDIQKWRRRRAKQRRHFVGVPVWAAAFGILIAMLAGFVGGQWFNTNPGATVRSNSSETLLNKRFAVNVGVTKAMDFVPNKVEMAISPDGTHIAYAANKDGVSRLYIRAIDRMEHTVVPDSEDVRLPFFSPDNRWVAYFGWFENNLQLLKTPVNGGRPQALCSTTTPMGGTWLPDGRIIYSQEIDGEGTYRLKQVPEIGGEGEPLLTTPIVEGDQYHVEPTALPGVDALLFTIGRDDSSTDVALLDLETREFETVIEHAYGAEYASSGHIVFVRANGIWATPFDLERRAVTGEEVQLQPERDYQVSWQHRPFALSAEGSFLFLPDELPRAPERILVWVTRDGIEETLLMPRAPYLVPRVSPDGKKIVVTRDDLENEDIWVHEVERPGSLARLTFDPDIDRGAIWMPDSERIVFLSRRDDAFNMYHRRIDGVGGTTRLHESNRVQTPICVSNDSANLLYLELIAGSGWGIGRYTFKDQSAGVLSDLEGSQLNACFSPDGKWIAYTSENEEEKQVYVRPFPNVTDGKYQISTDGGEQPLWSPKGDEIYYREGDRMMAVAVSTESGFQKDAPTVLFENEYYFDEWGANEYDLEYPGGERFLMIRELETEPSTLLIYVDNWTEELEHLAPANGE